MSAILVSVILTRVGLHHLVLGAKHVRFCEELRVDGCGNDVPAT